MSNGKEPISNERIELLESQIGILHKALEQRGVNTKGTEDIFGRPFVLPVNAEHKATVFNFHTLPSCAQPHMRAFWAATLGFFTTFFSTFAAAPLMAYIKKEDSLDLVKGDIVNSAVASVAGTIGMRLITGWLCDKFGARRAFAFILLLAVPGIVGIMCVQEAVGFIICRFLIGLGLATFVACQVWCSQQFDRSVVGAANATAGGWGNLGGGITNLVMPFIMLGMLSATDQDEDLSWRLCYIVPLAMHLLAAAYTLTGRDLPDGNFGELESSGAKQKTDSGIVVKMGASNLNAWIMTVTYGFCFGVELTMTNVAALYFYTDHGLSPQISGIFASLFGLMNLFARSFGGIMSDSASKKYGMRGRLWVMFVVQVIEGAFCLVMGVVTRDYASPDDSKTKTIGEFNHEEYHFAYPDLPFNLCPNHTDYKVTTCGTKDIKTKDLKEICQWVNGTNCVAENDPVNCHLNVVTRFDLDTRILIADLRDPDCIRAQDLVGTVVVIMICFSICVQMAEGLHFGVVPYISRPALGIVSGMVGAGGNAGAVLTLWAIFKNEDVPRTDEGFIILGIVVMATSFLMFGLYFPNAAEQGGGGGLLFKPNSLSYDPQRWKPSGEGFRGADVMDYSKGVHVTRTAVDKPDGTAEVA